MSAGKAAPSIVQDVVVRFGADLERDELVCGRPRRWFTARNEVGARTADGVFDDVGYEKGQEHADEPAEDGDMRFVRAGAENEGPRNEDAEGYRARVDEEPCWESILVSEGMREVMLHTNRYAFDFSMWVVNGKVIEEEHAMERFGEELDLCLFY